jgi:hypothetical protein
MGQCLALEELLDKHEVIHRPGDPDAGDRRPEGDGLSSLLGSQFFFSLPK